jgi:uncharacterized membrane protein YdbT with pleckstrin-like domain
MKYEKIWDKVLSDGEKIEYEFSYGERYLKVGLIAGVILGVLLLFAYVGFILLPIEIFLWAFYYRVSNAYALTNKRILIHKGWLSTRTTSIDYHKITDVAVSEPFLDRIIYHTGSILVDTAGMSGGDIVLSHIEKPYEVQKRLNLLKDKVSHHGNGI